MITSLRFRLAHRAYLHNEHGIKKFAEMSMGQLIHRVTKKSAFYREMNENLLVEKTNLRIRRDELYEQAKIRGARFFSVRRELWLNASLIVLILAGATVLHYHAIAAWIPDAVVFDVVVGWTTALLTAVVLTGGGMILSARLIDAVLPGAAPSSTQPTTGRMAPVLLWGGLLAGLEVILFGLADAPRTAFATRTPLPLSYGTAVMLLPLIAGALRWHTLRLLDPYKATLVLRRIENRLAQIDSILRQNDEFESNFYKVKCLEYWDQVNQFKTLKDIINRRKGLVEPLSGHFSRNYDLFQAEADRRYAQDIRDVTTPSPRKLDVLDKRRMPGTPFEQATSVPARRSAAGQKTPTEYPSLKSVR